MSGEGQFNLNILKEYTVTDDFLDLDLVSRGCQNVESHDSCTTRIYQRMMMDKCGCVPFATNVNGEVYRINQGF